MAVTETDLETRTRAIGGELFARVRRAGSGESWRDRWVMGRLMRDEAVKAQLFRFVDVLPALSGTPQVNEHLREYLGPVAKRLPGPLGRMVGWIPEHEGWLGERLPKITPGAPPRGAARV